MRDNYFDLFGLHKTFISHGTAHLHEKSWVSKYALVEENERNMMEKKLVINM